MSNNNAVTVRDKVWYEVLFLGINTRQRRPFTIEDLMERGRLDESNEKTIRRTLKAMEEMNVLHHEPYTEEWRIQKLWKSWAKGAVDEVEPPDQ